MSFLSKNDVLAMFAKSIIRQYIFQIALLFINFDVDTLKSKIGQKSEKSRTEIDNSSVLEYFRGWTVINKSIYET